MLKKVYREGNKNAGKRMNHGCGFCGQHFTSRRLRNRHTNECKK